MDVKGSQFAKEIILWGVRWYVVYRMSYRQLEEMMGEREVTSSKEEGREYIINPEPTRSALHQYH